jgi:hypothetical protein
MSITTGNPPTREAGVMDSTNSFWHSRRTLAAGLVLVAVASGATWAAVDRSQDSHPGAAGYDSACGLHGGATATPTTAPDVQWQNDGGDWLPVSNTQGPGRRDTNGAWSCFARTPVGAVLAAWTIPARLGDAAEFTAVVKQQTLPGPGQDARLKQGQTRHLASDEPLPLGFRVNAYDGSIATITFYVRQPGLTGRCASSVQWVGGKAGDWELRFATDGSAVFGCEKVADNLAGLDLVAWGPNS